MSLKISGNASSEITPKVTIKKEKTDHLLNYGYILTVFSGNYFKSHFRFSVIQSKKKQNLTKLSDTPMPQSLGSKKYPLQGLQKYKPGSKETQQKLYIMKLNRIFFVNDKRSTVIFNFPGPEDSNRYAY
ncbi:MAG: hypothetical protein EA361_07735 [Bacteroidetes bacterium]|nr:MAG: hypothetical protein EA361_07735 [Bacteroidota bacterium]